MNLRPICSIKWDKRMVRGFTRPKHRICRIVAELLIFDNVPHDVDAKPIDATAKPKAHYVIYGRTHLRISPIKIGLCLQKCVIIKLPGYTIELPGATAKGG